MSIDIEDPPEQTTASLVSGIFGDLKHLVEQQFQLTRQEIETGLRQRAAAAAVIGFGLGILFLAAVAICLTFSHLLHWAASPPGTDPAWMPLWVCHAVVAAVLAVSGVTVACVGRAKFRSIDPLQRPDNEILQEHTR
ncbi:MAG: phage holin family protein [Planctomycetaceae bacterium]|nr:phage holin family protein [Planctomycetaceae bacterium]